jgi:hypothetical protein
MQYSFIALLVPSVATIAPLHREIKPKRGELKKMKKLILRSRPPL